MSRLGGSPLQHVDLREGPWHLLSPHPRPDESGEWSLLPGGMEETPSPRGRAAKGKVAPQALGYPFMPCVPRPEKVLPMSSPCTRGASQLCPGAGRVPASLSVPVPLGFAWTHPRSLPEGKPSHKAGNRLGKGQESLAGTHRVSLLCALSWPRLELPFSLQFLLSQTTCPVPLACWSPEMAPATLDKETEDLGEGWHGAMPGHTVPAAVPRVCRAGRGPQQGPAATTVATASKKLLGGARGCTGVVGCAHGLAPDQPGAEGTGRRGCHVPRWCTAPRAAEPLPQQGPSLQQICWGPRTHSNSRIQPSPAWTPPLPRSHIRGSAGSAPSAQTPCPAEPPPQSCLPVGSGWTPAAQVRSCPNGHDLNGQGAQDRSNLSLSTWVFCIRDAWTRLCSP